MRRQGGFSLVELMIVVAVLAIVTALVINRYSDSVKLEAAGRGSAILNQVFSDNVTEIKGQGRATLPASGSCRHRIYDPNTLIILSDVVALNGSSVCNKDVPSSQGIDVLWIISGPDTISSTVSFSPATFLKLPKYNDSIVQLELVALVAQAPPNPQVRRLGMVFYKK